MPADVSKVVLFSNSETLCQFLGFSCSVSVVECCSYVVTVERSLFVRVQPNNCFSYCKSLYLIIAFNLLFCELMVIIYHYLLGFFNLGKFKIQDFFCEVHDFVCNRRSCQLIPSSSRYNLDLSLIKARLIFHQEKSFNFPI